MKTLIKLASFLAISWLIVFVLVIFRYQQLVNEGASLTDERCIKVNPTLIERKKAYIESIKAMANSVSQEEFIKAEEKYINAMQINADTDSQWIEKDERYVNRWDFKLLAPGSIQKVSQLQLKSFKADLDLTKIMIALSQSFFATESASQKEKDTWTQELERLTKERDQAEKELNTLLDNSQAFTDIRIRLTKLPEFKCPDENQQIPDVNSELQNLFPQESIPSTTIEQDEIKS